MDEFEKDDRVEEDGASEANKASRDISSDLIRGHINTIILRTLIDGEKYGNEIINEIENRSRGQYTLKQPTLYSALKRLESLGYVTSYWGGVSSGGRRRYFSLTDSGKAFSAKNIGEWEYSRTIIDNLISDNVIKTDDEYSIENEIVPEENEAIVEENRQETPNEERLYNPSNPLYRYMEFAEEDVCRAVYNADDFILSIQNEETERQEKAGDENDPLEGSNYYRSFCPLDVTDIAENVEQETETILSPIEFTALHDLKRDEGRSDSSKTARKAEDFSHYSYNENLVPLIAQNNEDKSEIYEQTTCCELLLTVRNEEAVKQEVNKISVAETENSTLLPEDRALEETESNNEDDGFIFDAPLSEEGDNFFEQDSSDGESNEVISSFEEDSSFNEDALTEKHFDDFVLDAFEETSEPFDESDDDTDIIHHESFDHIDNGATGKDSSNDNDDVIVHDAQKEDSVKEDSLEDILTTKTPLPMFNPDNETDLPEDIERISLDIEKTSEQEILGNTENSADKRSDISENEDKANNEELPSISNALNSYEEEFSFSDDDYHRLLKRSKIIGEYKNIIDTIFDSAITTADGLKNEQSDYYVNQSNGFCNPLTEENPPKNNSASPKKILNDTPDIYQEHDDIYKEAAYLSNDQFIQSAHSQPASSETSYTQNQSDNSYFDEDDFFHEKSMNSSKKISESDLPKFDETFSQTTSDSEENQGDSPITVGLKEAIDFSDIRKSARADGIKLLIACGSKRVTPLPEVLFDKGVALLKASLMTAIIAFVEGILVLLFKERLEIPLSYPLILLLLPIAVSLIFAILYFCKGQNKVHKTNSSRYITTATVLFIVAVMIICAVSIGLGIKLENTEITMKYILIPCIYAFNIVFFALFYHLFASKSKI